MAPGKIKADIAGGFDAQGTGYHAAGCPGMDNREIAGRYSGRGDGAQQHLPSAGKSLS